MDLFSKNILHSWAVFWLPIGLTDVDAFEVFLGISPLYFIVLYCIQFSVSYYSEWSTVRISFNTVLSAYFILSCLSLVSAPKYSLF